MNQEVRVLPHWSLRSVSFWLVSQLHLGLCLLLSVCKSCLSCDKLRILEDIKYLDISPLFSFLLKFCCYRLEKSAFNSWELLRLKFYLSTSVWRLSAFFSYSHQDNVERRLRLWSPAYSESLQRCQGLERVWAGMDWEPMQYFSNCEKGYRLLCCESSL